MYFTKAHYSQLLSALSVIPKLDCVWYAGIHLWKSTEISEYVATEAICSSKTSVDIQRTTRRYIQEVRKEFSVKDPGEQTAVAEITNKKK
jgi:hypothetical protein